MTAELQISDNVDASETNLASVDKGILFLLQLKWLYYTAMI